MFPRVCERKPGFEVCVCVCVRACDRRKGVLKEWKSASVCVCAFKWLAILSKSLLCWCVMFCIYACMDSVCMRVKCLKALYTCARVCARPGGGSEQSLSDTLSNPPHLPPCDGLSWMLMFCDGCGANKCFWHSTGSHYRSRPNGLASALMSRQVSQPQPLYQSHILLMQGVNLSTPRPDPGKKKKTLTSVADPWLEFYKFFSFIRTVGLLRCWESSVT